VQHRGAKFAGELGKIERAAGRMRRRKVKSIPFREKNGELPFNASGVVQVGPDRFLFIDNQDSSSFFEFTLDDDAEVKRIRRRRLVGVAEGQFSDPEGLTRVDLDGETFLIAASSLCAEHAKRPGRVSDGLVRVRYTPDGDLQAEAMSGFRRWLLAHEPSLASACEQVPDAGGMNIEGLAWDPRAGALVFGQRGPADPGRFTVIQVPVDVGRAPWTTASLKAPSILHARTPEPGAALGIRDLTYDEQIGAFLVLLGRSISRGDEPFQLCTWDGSSDDVNPLDVVFHRSMKPEGITTFPRGDKKKVIIVDDRGGYAVLDFRPEWR
jgi:hypothetical protein